MNNVFQDTLKEFLLRLTLQKVMSYPQINEIIKKQRQKKINQNALISMLSRLKKEGLINQNDKGWFAEKKALNYLKKKLPKINKNSDIAKQNKKKEKDMIIFYDIPEEFRRERDWLRVNLGILGFAQKQKSVWIRPSPLPEEFIEFLNNKKIIAHINFFRIREEEIV